MIVRDRDLGMRRIFRDLRSLKGSHTKVGVQQGAERKDASPMVEVAAAQEYGTEDIPERSFLRSSHDENRERYARHLGNGATQILSGARTPQEVLAGIGQVAQDDVKAKIRSNIPPALAPATVEDKGSSVALIDTAQLIGSIRHVEHIRGQA